MKTTRSSIFCFAVLLLASPMLRAQEFSKYRNFSLGTSLATVLKQIDQTLADVKVAHTRPALIQELTWWPPSLPGSSYQADSVQQMRFSFYNGELYKISVIYDRTATEGLTAGDMVKSISAKYGSATSIGLEKDSTSTEQSGARPQPVASWADTQYSLKLVRSSFSGGFELAIFSTQVNAEAELAISEAAKLDDLEGPKREAERQKKGTDDLELARMRNQKSFHP